MQFKIKVIAVLLFYLTAGELLAQPSAQPRVLSSQLERVSDHWRSELITEDLYWHTYRGSGQCLALGSGKINSFMLRMLN